MPLCLLLELRVTPTSAWALSYSDFCLGFDFCLDSGLRSGFSLDSGFHSGLHLDSGYRSDLHLDTYFGLALGLQPTKITSRTSFLKEKIYRRVTWILMMFIGHLLPKICANQKICAKEKIQCQRSNLRIWNISAAKTIACA